MKYKQTILDDEGIELRERILEFDIDERTAGQPLFIGQILRLERDFLEETFTVKTERIA